IAIGMSGARADEAQRREAAALFGELKAPLAATALAELGRELFWDTRASLDGKTACASCHPARDWGADRRRFSPDARGALTSRHSPTIFNSMSQPMLRWLGDRKSGADQAEGSLTGSMGFAGKDVGIAKLAELGYAPKFGLTKDYWLETGSEKPDVGRVAVTKKEEDRYVFRVPMLRNVAKTAPYFHDGSVPRLDQAVRIMGVLQLGRTLDDAAVSEIV